MRYSRLSLETDWTSEEGIGSRGQVVAWLDVTILLTSSEERGLKWVKTVVGNGDRGWEDGGRGKRADVFHLGKVCKKSPQP